MNKLKMLLVLAILTNNLIFVSSQATLSSWFSYDYNESVSSPCLIKDKNNDPWICGGKSTSSFNSCRHLKINSTSFSYSKTRKTLKYSTMFAGYYYSSSAFYCDNQNIGGYYNTKGCILNINDGTNDAKCVCCSLSDSSSSVNCDDLSLTSQCDDVFEACVVHDTTKNRLIQIGGTSSGTYLSNIKCFNITSQQYASSCEFGSLYYGTWYSGCAMVGSDLLVVVGGESTQKGSYMKQIQLCKKNSQCYIAKTNLTYGLENTRVLALDSCTIVIIGGKTSTFGYSNMIYYYNVCTDSMIKTDTLPISMSDFGLYNANGLLCTIGGLTQGSNFVTKIYCSKTGITDSPTTAKPTTLVPTLVPTPKPTTLAPTRYPTLKPTPKPTTLSPTKTPTISPTKAPTSASTSSIKLNSWSNFYSFSSKRTAQSCATGSNRMYIFGGIEWTSTSSLSPTNTFISMNSGLAFSSYTVKKYYPAYNLYTTMDTFYCEHQCAAYYQNKMYLVSPIGSNANQILFYECLINDTTSQVICSDICSDTSHYSSTICSNINFQPCVTSIDQYLIIVGGTTSNKIFKDIYIWDMSKNSWVSTNVLNFGYLSDAVYLSSCSIWNSKLYVFGGKSSSSKKTIQICSQNIGGITSNCSKSTVSLNVQRSYAQATTVGKSIVITCGEINSTAATDVVEIYDAQYDTISTGSSLYGGNRKQCCLTNFQTKLFVSGGETVSNAYSVSGVNTIISANYTLSSSTTTKPIYQCNLIYLISSNSVFSNYYYRTNSTYNGYYVWIDKSNLYSIYYKPSNSCWVGGDTKWAYSSANTLETGTWFYMASKTSRATRVTVTISCSDKQIVREKKQNSNLIFGIKKWTFLGIVIIFAVILILISIIAILCYNRQKRKMNQRVLYANTHFKPSKVKIPTTIITTAATTATATTAHQYDSVQTYSTTPTTTTATTITSFKSINNMNNGNSSNSNMNNGTRSNSYVNHGNSSNSSMNPNHNHNNNNNNNNLSVGDRSYSRPITPINVNNINNPNYLVTSELLFGNPKTPEWQKKAKEAVEKQNESDSEEKSIDLKNMHFDSSEKDAMTLDIHDVNNHYNQTNNNNNNNNNNNANDDDDDENNDETKPLSPKITQQQLFANIMK